MCIGCCWGGEWCILLGLVNCITAVLASCDGPLPCPSLQLPGLSRAGLRDFSFFFLSFLPFNFPAFSSWPWAGLRRHIFETHSNRDPDLTLPSPSCRSSAAPLTLEMEPPQKRQKQQRTLGSMFGLKPSTTPKRRLNSIQLPDGWYARDNSVLVRRDIDCNYTSCKVASFDFDGCLVMDATFTWRSNSPLPIRPGVIERLRQLHQDNYRVVIFTNEKTISNRKTPLSITKAIEDKISRLNEFVRTVSVPMEIFVATADDQYRKGNGTGMWRLMLEDCMEYRSVGETTESSVQRKKNEIEPVLAESFFVGDAAGRPNDHGNGDLMFAESLKIEFYTETAYFPLAAPSGAKIEALNCLCGTQMLIVLSGLPGSGKSMFANTLLERIRADNNEGNKWVVVCQDALKTRKACEDAVQLALMEGKSVVVDRTNVSKEQRSYWICLAHERWACNVIAIVFGEDMETKQLVRHIQERNTHPTLGSDTPVAQIRVILRRMTNNYEHPSLSEGLDLVYHVTQEVEERNKLAVGLNDWINRLRLDASAKSSESFSSTSSSSTGESKVDGVVGTSILSTGVVPAPTAVPTASPLPPTPPTPPTFMFSPISLQSNYSPTPSEEVDIILERSINFLRMHSSFHLELVLDTTNAERHRELHAVLCALPSSSFPPARFRLLASVDLSQYPVVNESTADIVSTSAEFRFSATGSSMNRTLHRTYNLAAETAGHSEKLQRRTNQRHKHCKPNNSYVVDVPTGVRLSSSSSSSSSSGKEGTTVEVRHIVHTMGTNNMMDAYTTMFNVMQLNYLAPPHVACTTSTITSATTSAATTLQVMPITYNPPADTPSKTGGWAKVLNDYLQPQWMLTERQQDQIFMETSKFVVIYDGYPKSSVHLLLIPRPSFLNRLWPRNVVGNDLKKIQMLHCAAKEMKRHIEQHFLNAENVVVPKGTTINVGYHATPSLQRMHIHLISNNFESRHMKTAKHRNSFQTDFFVDIDQFEKEVAERD